MTHAMTQCSSQQEPVSSGSRCNMRKSSFKSRQCEEAIRTESVWNWRSSKCNWRNDEEQMSGEVMNQVLHDVSITLHVDVTNVVGLADEGDCDWWVGDHRVEIGVEQVCICDQSFGTFVAPAPMIIALHIVYLSSMVTQRALCHEQVQTLFLSSCACMAHAWMFVVSCVVEVSWKRDTFPFGGGAVDQTSVP